MKLGPQERESLRRMYAAGRTVKEIHAALGGDAVCSLGTVHRAIRPLKLADGSARTNSRRHRRPGMDALGAAALSQLMHLIYHVGRTSAQAVEDLVANQAIAPADAPHPNTVDRWMREMGLTRRAARAPKRGPRVTEGFQAPAANVLHQFDATRMAIYYIDVRGDIFYEPDDPKKAKRRDAGKTPVNVFALIDDYSRCCYLRAYDGETIPNWFDFLHRAWSLKSEPSAFPFWGLPARGYTDNASAISQSFAGRRIFHSGLLGVKLSTHVPGQAWSKGKVERLMRSVNTEETGLRRDQFEGFDDLNLWLERVARYLNSRVHGTTRERPFNRWCASMEAQRREGGQLREPPDWATWQRWLLREAEVTINTYFQVSLGGERVQLPRVAPFLDMAGRKVTVLFRPDCEDDFVLIAGDAEWSLPRTAAGLKAWINRYADRRTSGEIVRDGTRDVDVSALDLSKRLELHTLDGYDAPTSGEPYRLPADLAAQRALAEAAAVEQLTRRQVIGRLREAGLVGEPLTDGDVRLVDRLVGDAELLDSRDLESAIADLTTIGSQRAAGA